MQSPADGKLQRAEIGAFGLESGQTLHDCQLSYRTYGAINTDRSNVIMVPTWYTGTTQGIFDAGLVGPGKTYNTDTYYVITIDALGNGVSSSPSNSKNQAGVQFPDITIRDMVRSQYQLLTECFEFKHVHMVSGISMGGEQTFEWMMLYPRFADNYLSILGMPWRTAYHQVLMLTYHDILSSVIDDSERVQKAARLLGQISVLTAYTPDFINRIFGLEDVDGLLTETISAQGDHSFSRMQDILSQTKAMLTHDIRTSVDDFEKHITSLKDIRAAVIDAPSDMMMNPGPSFAFAEMLGIESYRIEGDGGHMSFDPGIGPGAETLAGWVRQFLKA